MRNIIVQFSCEDVLSLYIFENGSCFQKQLNRTMMQNQIAQETNKKQQEQSTQTASWCQFFRFSDRTDYFLMTVGTIASILIGTAMPLFAIISGNMIDAYGSFQDLQPKARKHLFSYLYLAAGSFITALIMFFCWKVTGGRQSVKCRKEYFKSLMRQELAWFDDQNQSEISTTFALDSMSFELAIGEKISNLIMICSMFVGGIVVSFVEGWILSAVLLLYLPVIICLHSKNIRVKVEVSEQEEQIYHQSDSRAQETIHAIKLVKQLNGEEFEVSAMRQMLLKFKGIFAKLLVKFSVLQAIAILSLFVSMVIVALYGTECVLDTKVCPQSISFRAYTAGSIIRIFYAMCLPAISLNQFSPCHHKIVEGKNAVARISSIIDREPIIKSSQNAIVPEQFKGVFEFKNVKFNYPKNNRKKKVFECLNMKIDCAKAVIKGKSGCGKSTIMQLIMRFYDPDEGEVTLDGVNLKDISIEWLRSQIGYVGQEPVLFATSIRQNLLLGNQHATEEDITQALASARALDFMESLRNGLDTFVGSGGSQLSGGQKQRIAIARALLKKPKVLLMDEATSALDSTNQRQILKNVMQRQKIQIISISHRQTAENYSCKVFYINNFRLENEVLMQEKEPEIQKNAVSVCSRGVVSERNQQLVDDKKQEEIEEVSFGRILPFLKEEKCLFALSLLFAILEGLFFPVITLFFSLITYELLLASFGADNKALIHEYVFISIGLSIAGAIFNALALVTFAMLGEAVVRNIRITIYQKIMKMPMSWFGEDENQPDKITSRVNSNAKNLYSFIKNSIAFIIIAFINIIGGVALSLYYEWRSGLTSIALIPLILISQIVQAKVITGFNQSSGKVYEESAQIVNQNILNIRTTLSLGQPEVFLKKYFGKIDKLTSQLRGQCFFSGIMFALSYFFQYTTFGLMFYLGAVYAQTFSISPSNTLTSILLIIGSCVAAGNNIYNIGSLSEAKKSTRELFKMIDEEDEHQLWAKGRPQLLKDSFTGNIKFQNVSFQYTKGVPVLQNFNFKISNGEHVGIVGQSGCGKSTILNLLLGFYIPTRGRILIEDVDIRDYDLHYLRTCFGLVEQEPTLFNQSIERNILYNLDLKKADVVKAAKNASLYFNFSGLQETINNLNASCETEDRAITTSADQHNDLKITYQREVGPKGCHVSGGQKQRIAIARTFLRKPAALLLDEVTSALDKVNEENVQDNIESLMKGKTTINITHNLATKAVKNADHLIILVKGQIKEQGPFQDLIKKEGYFADMYNARHKNE